MSAIAGIYQVNDEPINLEHGKKLMKELETFPADDVQSWNNERVFLGCHAQWITPESKGEKLPYFDHERKLAITADAIIDNREELYERLQVDKWKQKEITDSELILLSYHKWEEDSPKYLIGDFAFIIWDERKRKLFGARDFSGSRTLYFNYNQQTFSFCSTIKPLLALPKIEKKLNEQWLAQYLAIVGMIDVVEADATPYKEIFQLPPSHSFSIVNGKLTLKQYCLLKPGESLRLKSNLEYVEAFQEIFQQAVSSRLRTYHDVGAQLSGGLDSGSIVSFASKLLKLEGKKLHTLSYIPPQDFKDFTPNHLMPDETPFIKATVQHVGNISDKYFAFEGREPFSEIDSFLEIMEMPYKFFENSYWLKGMFEKAHDQKIGVLLNGGRGNLSISWGSAFDYYVTLLKKLKLVHLLKELKQYSQKAGASRLLLFSALSREAFPFLYRVPQVDSSYIFPKMINPEFEKKTNVIEKLKDHGMDGTGWFATTNIYEQRNQHFEDVFHWNASNTIASKLSLRYSLWKRDPSNDLRVIRFCLSLPEEQYVQNGLDRALIRRATESYLPDKVRLNQKISGVQGADWVHRMAPVWGSFKKELQEMIRDNQIFEFINDKVIREAVSKVKEYPNPESATDPHFKILMRAIIVHRFIKNYT
ncbi:lasso peptide isopeptide bond-forming cyclase [Bacillus sp. USDA818B3_A]|uniref:lasso peptide isopeptide bond-forming cyclase n=1 Tax=Bacillus sp. USDA818B3_A TaxID=2698834 RepID=UPI00136E2D83|nr:lasso peptide isopeptide bond-forming cyclase [Bacillus sp. USDA818B3_A]